jgi:hypothetical protein
MNGRIRHACAVAALVSLAVLGSTQADSAKKEAAQAATFKGKTFDLKENGKGHITLTFPAGKTFSVTVKSEKESDVNLFIYDGDKKVVAKDDSPGPSCKLSFTPAEAGKYTLEVVNKGPGANKSTLQVKAAKTKP